ncbi:MAG: Sel1 domain protein repeat-containing protein [Burkholderiaceae bacterium]|nr:Sel1 domain protein repeat-containing protein [Burkholderiaceae bacterium]
MHAGLKKWGAACAIALATMAMAGCTSSTDLEKEYTIKAQKGDAEAQHQLSMLYLTANGVDHSDKKGTFWARKAANQGHPEAQNNVGEMYASGVTVKKNLVEADKWLTLSSNQGFGPATRRMKDLEETMTPQQVAQAKELAKDWKPVKE